MYCSQCRNDHTFPFLYQTSLYLTVSMSVVYFVYLHTNLPEILSLLALHKLKINIAVRYSFTSGSSPVFIYLFIYLLIYLIIYLFIYFIIIIFFFLAPGEFHLVALVFVLCCSSMQWLHDKQIRKKTDVFFFFFCHFYNCKVLFMGGYLKIQ